MTRAALYHRTGHEATHAPGASARLALIAAGCVLVPAAAVAVMLVPDRLQLVLLVRSGGANQIVLPLGYWALVALWAWIGARAIGAAPSMIVARAATVGVVLHFILLLAAFSGKLLDPSAFSSPIYRSYTRLFCAAAVAFSVAATIDWLRRRATTASLDDYLQIPIGLGAAILAVALVRADPMGAGAGLLIGAVIAAAVAAAATDGGAARTIWQRVRPIVADERVFLFVVFLAACALRVLYTRRVMTDPDFVATGGDGPTYDRLAWSIAEGHGIPAAFRNEYPLLLLGYVWFVSAVYAIAGHSYFVLCLVQSILGAAACLLIYGVAKPLFGAATARLAAAFTAVNFLLLFSAAAIGHQAVDVFLTALIAWLLLRMAEAGRAHWSRWVVAGAMLGCAIAVRETNAVFLAFVLLWMPFAFGRQLGRWGTARAAAALMAGVLLVLTPLVAPAVASADNRLRLRQHFDRLFTGQGDDVRTRKELAGPLEDPAAALAQFRTRPGFVAGTLGTAMVHNFAVQFFTQPYGAFDFVFLVKGSAYYYGMWFYAYALACLGIVTAVRRVRIGGAQAAGIVLVLGVLAARTLPHLVLESHYRHRAPIEPFLILMAAAGAIKMLHEARLTSPLERANG